MVSLKIYIWNAWGMFFPWSLVGVKGVTEFRCCVLFIRWPQLLSVKFEIVCFNKLMLCFEDGSILNQYINGWSMLFNLSRQYLWIYIFMNDYILVYTYSVIIMDYDVIVNFGSRIMLFFYYHWYFGIFWSKLWLQIIFAKYFTTENVLHACNILYKIIITIASFVNEMIIIWIIFCVIDDQWKILISNTHKDEVIYSWKVQGMFIKVYFWDWRYESS